MRAEIDKARAKNSRGASVRLHSLIRAATLRVCWSCVNLVTSSRTLCLTTGWWAVLGYPAQQRKRDWLREHGKTPNRCILFVGRRLGKTCRRSAGG